MFRLISSKLYKHSFFIKTLKRRDQLSLNMIYRESIQTLADPYKNEMIEDIKALRIISKTLSLTTRRESEIKHDAETIEKSTLMLISAIMLKCGLDTARKFQNSICDIILYVLKLVESSQDKSTILNKLIDVFNSENQIKPLSVHRTTLQRSIPQLTKKSIDKTVENDYVNCISDLKEIRGVSKKIIISIDSTHQGSRTKYRNGNLRYIHIGQSTNWERGYEFPSIYDCTNQLFLGVNHVDNFLPDNQKRLVREWIQTLQKKVKLVESTGSNVKVIEGDRLYFTAEGFATAYLGLFNEGKPSSQQPRLVIPRKLTKGKDDFKWNYLLNNDISQVFMETIGLSPRKTPGLKNMCKGTFPKSSDYSRFLIPYVCVAMVDEYHKKSNRSLKKIRKIAQKTQKKIESIENELPKVTQEYLNYRKQLGHKNIRLPSIKKGKRRKFFEDKLDKDLYFKIHRLLNELKALKTTKTGLLKSLMFFAISTRPNEDPTRNPKMFIKYAEDFHERWGIENGFKDIKQVFIRNVRNRKPTRRLLNIAFGMVLYNHWHTDRMKIMVKQLRNNVWNIVPWIPTRSWVRRKIEKKFGSKLSAKSYLIDIWSKGVKKLLIKKFVGLR